jgi:heme A synthase
MSVDLILIVGAVVVGLAYFAVRNNRKQKELKTQARRMG